MLLDYKMRKTRPLLQRYDLLLLFCFVLAGLQCLRMTFPTSPLPYHDITITINTNTHSPTPPIQPVSIPRDLTAANATLGFELILAISAEDLASPTSWRRNGLLKAANRTGLDIQIPTLPDFTMAEVDRLREGGEMHRRPHENQARAWLAHMHVIQHIIDSNVSTALILEDDADWDLSLLSQLPPIASAVRTLTSSLALNPSNQLHSSTPDPTPQGPYGQSWDILHLGHCGLTPLSAPSPNTLIQDPSLLLPQNLKSIWGPAFYSSLPAHTRAIGYTDNALCTFGYALTRRGALKVRAWMSENGEAFDVRLRDGCANGGLECLGVSPEVFRHQRRVGATSLSMGWNGGTGKGIGKVKSGAKAENAVEQEKNSDDSKGAGEAQGTEARSWTFNLRHSARCNWNRGEGWPVPLLRSCWPTEEEWNEYNT